MKKLMTLSALLFLSACFSDDPGTQCLNSFKSSLKDPDSGKVIDFTPPTLTYSATNSYGARIQGKALCQEYDKKWTRDFNAENMSILQKSTDKLKESNACRINGGKKEDCAGSSLVLKHMGDVSIDSLNKESRIELGFN